MKVKIVKTKVAAFNDVLRAYGDMDTHQGVFAFFSDLSVKNDEIRGYVKPLLKDVEVYDPEQDKDKSLTKKIYEAVIGGVLGLLENKPRHEAATITDMSGPVENPHANTWQIVERLVQNAFFKAILPGLNEWGDMTVSNPWKLGGLTLTELGRRLWDESQKDELLGRAAQLSYYALLALFPALIFLTALMGLFSVQSFMPELMSYLRNVLPADALSMVQRFLTQVAEGSGANILSLGALGALWASSSGVTAIMDALNVVFGVKEDRRPFWRVRLTAIVLTIGLAGFVIMSLALVLYGPTIGRWIADLMGFDVVFTWIWNVLQWPVIATLMLIVVAAIYHICPDRRYKRWRWVTRDRCLPCSRGCSCRWASKPMSTISATTTRSTVPLPASSC